jgi:hypothetical protein
MRPAQIDKRYGKVEDNTFQENFDISLLSKVQFLHQLVGKPNAVFIIGGPASGKGT